MRRIPYSTSLFVALNCFALNSFLQAVQAPDFSVFDPGRESIVDYDKYGTITNPKTAKYRYLIRDREGLGKAVGEGIYPNIVSLLKDPEYQKAKYEGKLEGPVWNFVTTDNLQLNFFKWASSNEPLGVKQFYAGEMLEKAGLINHAIKAYYAAVIHDPKAIGNTFWKTPWYIGPTALDRIAYLTRENPELGMRLKGARIRILNRFDDNIHNDVFEIDPGELLPQTPNQAQKLNQHIDVQKLAVKRQIGKGKVTLKQYSNGHAIIIFIS